jgi:site-specific DNA-cytosine methylase
MTAVTYRAFFPFGGMGAGAAGILAARMSLLGREARFACVGGIDLDPAACADFEYLTGTPELCADIVTLVPEDLRRVAGPLAPDLVFLSPPCKGASGLLSESQSQTAKYRAMNQLAIIWIRLMLATWDEPPRLVLIENVPRLKTRAGGMLREIRSLLHGAGYVCRDGFHDCGELGGLAQRRRRYLLVARHAKRVPPILYQPVKRRVRACGEVLAPLPMPEDMAAGPMHRLPRISWLNWVRLALIPAGGDWRDLPGVLAAGEKRREKFERYPVAGWDEATGTVAGSGSNGVFGVADPRAGIDPKPAHSDPCAPAVTDGEQCGGIDPNPPNPTQRANWFKGKYGVTGWDGPARTVIGGPSNGAGFVADPRIGLKACKPGSYHNNYRVEDWEQAAHTVVGATRPGSGAPSVADPRPHGWFPNVLGVVPWDRTAGTVTGESRPSNGAFSVADPRVKNAFDHGYAVLSWTEHSPTVAGKSHPGNGAFSVADPRLLAQVPLTCHPRERSYAYGVIPWSEAAKTITGSAQIDNGAWAVADPRLPESPPLFVVRDPRKPPSAIPVIVAADGTWHRPLTTLELAVLQGLPPVHNGAPLQLHGSNSSGWRERIGNAVPPPAGQAIGERMLIALLQADFEAFGLAPADSPVWVEPEAFAARFRGDLS